MEPINLSKLFPDLVSTVAVIAVVMIFLKNQKEFSDSLKSITTDFSKKVEDLQKSFENQIERLTNNYLGNEKIYQAQIQKLFDDFISISRETIVAVKELEAAVRSLKEEVNSSRIDGGGRSTNK